MARLNNSQTEQHRLNRGKSRKIRRFKALDILGSACKFCGFDDPRTLQIDHVIGGPGGIRSTMRKLGKRVPITSLIVVRLHKQKLPLDEFELLCANCHVIKTLESGERLRAHKTFLP